LPALTLVEGGSLTLEEASPPPPQPRFSALRARKVKRRIRTEIALRIPILLSAFV
jgi:hypothetical protein